MSQSYADDLLAYFTDVENLRDLFRAYLASAELPKRILIIHGVGGIGKSSLLRMFRLHCKSVKTPIALASGDEAKSVVAILGDWADDLKADGVTLATFAKTRQHYRAIQARAEDKAQESRKKMGDLAGKTAGKIAETAAGAAVGAAIGSAIPGIGTIAGALGGMGAEALVDWLRGQGFAKQDIDLLLDPAKKLADDFLADIERVAPKRRLVLMLDTFEQLSTLEDWARDLAQRLHPNILLVIAGRAMLNWGRAWPGWLAQAHVEELKPMTDDVMRELVRRYYTTMRGGEPDPKQVEAIIAFARGLPMVVTSAVQLWVEHGVEDFAAVKAEVVADLVDRLKEGVPESMTLVLEAAATVRWFNKDILRAVTGLADVNQAYDELRRFPFVRSRVEGLALHDAVREIMDEYLRVHDPDRHRELHERAAKYFEAQVATRTGEEADRLELEQLYHRIRADEDAGIQLFQETAEGLTRYRFVNRLRTLLNDANVYALERENSKLWREYYNAKLAQLEGRLDHAEKVYQAIGENERANAKLTAYALCDFGILLARWGRLSQKDSPERTVTVLEQGLSASSLDTKLAEAFWALRSVYASLADWNKAAMYLQRARQFFEDQVDTFGTVLTLDRVKSDCTVQGLWREMIDAQNDALALIPPLSNTSFARARVLGGWGVGLIWAGKYRESECNLRESLRIAREMGETDLGGFLRDLGYAVGMQGKYDDAETAFSQSIQTGEEYREPLQSATTLTFQGAIFLRLGKINTALDLLNEATKIKTSLEPIGLIEIFNYIGRSQESIGQWDLGASAYSQAMSLRKFGRRYFECGALTGLVRVKYAQGEYQAIPPLLSEADQLAQQYEYNDHLTSLRLTQGHVAWDSSRPEWDSGFDAALRYYQHALIYALRYNRFLLDEALSGRPQGTPLRPIIPHCLERGEEGRQMLMTLRDWWQTGVNDVGTPRPDTISPIPEGIPLLEAERVAREREPGDGSPQRAVLEQIDAALSR